MIDWYTWMTCREEIRWFVVGVVLVAGAGFYPWLNPRHKK